MFAWISFGVCQKKAPMFAPGDNAAATAARCLFVAGYPGCLPICDRNSEQLQDETLGGSRPLPQKKPMGTAQVQMGQHG